MIETTSTARAANHFALPGTGQAEAVLGTSVTYKAQALETGGQLVCAEIAVPPGQGIPPHRHSDEDEAFYVLAGRVIIEGDECGDGVGLDTGGFFYGPRGRVHGFRCDGTESAKLLVFITPGTGIGAMFADLAELTRRQRDGIDPAQVAAVCGRYGVTFAPA